jgi:uncharacterized repeat protein (TIGR01451 family)
MEKALRKEAFLILTLVLFLGLFPVSGAWAQKQSPQLTLDISVHKEVIVLKDGKRVIEHVSVDKTRRDDTLVYTITYTNAGETAAQDAAVVDPVPEGALYVLGSASGPGAQVLCSINGGFSYHEPPVKYTIKGPGGTLEEKEAPAEMYTHIKWIIKKRLQPGASGRLSFKVKVK